jgi:hypothetical protein
MAQLINYSNWKMKDSSQCKGVAEEGYEYWANLSKTKRRLIVFHGEEVLDLTEFAKIHPTDMKAL